MTQRIEILDERRATIRRVEMDKRGNQEWFEDDCVRILLNGRECVVTLPNNCAPAETYSVLRDLKEIQQLVDRAQRPARHGKNARQ